MPIKSQRYKWISRLTLLMMALGSTACGIKHTSTTASTVRQANGPFAIYPDFYQMVADGAQCVDLVWLRGECEYAPGGAFGGNAGPGVCGDAKASCYLAVNLRNQKLGCWPSDSAITPQCQ